MAKKRQKQETPDDKAPPKATAKFELMDDHEFRAAVTAQAESCDTLQAHYQKAKDASLAAKKALDEGHNELRGLIADQSRPLLNETGAADG